MARSAAPAPSEETLPRFRRPTRRDAIDFACELFLRGERVDMNTVCAGLGIGRTTLYRWVGDRERLIGEALAELTEATWNYLIENAEGRGRERAMNIGRRFMEVTAEFPPLREFAEREPQLALRVLLAPDSLVAERIRAGFRRALEENLPPGAAINPELIDIAVQAGTALEWVPIAIGGEPEIERAGRLILSLFAAAEA